MDSLADSFVSMILQSSAVEEEESYLFSKGISPGMILCLGISAHSSLQILILFFSKAILILVSTIKK